MGRKIPEGVTVASRPENTLPELPSRPPYPCPHLTPEEVQTYLAPLYERGWGLYTKVPVDDKPATLMLAKDVSFVWHFPLGEFLTGLNAVTKAENHHPRVAYEFRTVELRMHTHGAIPTIESPKSEVIAGITLRDIRLAYRIEEVLLPFYELGKIAETECKFAQPNSLPKLASRSVPNAAPPKTRCIVCGGSHWSTTCPSRFTIKPQFPCEICGGDHWKFACAQFRPYRKSKMARKSDVGLKAL
ncbi:hypothetical protein CPB86DRAFT_712890 [Serendipita vermifera]|nr:hypothetical protein CPB86DRAFT_712890 [Serendipita vermifera]